MKNILYMIGAESVGKTSVAGVLSMLLLGRYVECDGKDVSLDNIINDAAEDKDTWIVAEMPPEIVLSEGVMARMKESGIVVMLKASPEELAWRASGCPEVEEEEDEDEDYEEDIEADEEEEICIFDEALVKRLKDQQEKLETAYQKGSGIKLDTTSLDVMEIVQILHMILAQ